MQKDTRQSIIQQKGQTSKVKDSKMEDKRSMDGWALTNV